MIFNKFINLFLHPITSMPPSNKLELVARRRQIAHMSLQGIPVADIAKKFNVTERQIYLDLAQIKNDWRKQQFHNVDMMMNQTLEEVELLKNTYWDAWHKSKEPMQTKRKKVRQDAPKSKPGDGTKGDGTKAPDKEGFQSVEVSEETKEKEGNAIYLKGVENCLHLRADLLGLKKINMSIANPDKELTPDDVKGLPTAELLKILGQKEEK